MAWDIFALHGARIGRVPGADLAQEICSHSAEKGHRLFIYGASEDVNRDATAVLRNRFPGIMIVGRSHGYVPQEEAKADILIFLAGDWLIFRPFRKSEKCACPLAAEGDSPRERFGSSP